MLKTVKLRLKHFMKTTTRQLLLESLWDPGLSEFPSLRMEGFWMNPSLSELTGENFKHTHPGGVFLLLKRTGKKHDVFGMILGMIQVCEICFLLLSIFQALAHLLLMIVLRNCASFWHKFTSQQVDVHRFFQVNSNFKGIPTHFMSYLGSTPPTAGCNHGKFP